MGMRSTGWEELIWLQFWAESTTLIFDFLPSSGPFGLDVISSPSFD